MTMRPSMNASISSRKTTLGVPNFLAFAPNKVRVLAGNLTDRNAEFLVFMVSKFFAFGVASVARLYDNATHAQ